MEDFPENIDVLQQRQWERFNSLIPETNNTIGLEFYENATFLSNDSHTSYVQGKPIGLSPTAIYSLLHLQRHEVCVIRTYKDQHSQIKDTTGNK